MKKRYRSIIFWLLQVAWLTAGAVRPYTPAYSDVLSERWRWRHFPELEGKGMRCMVEDARGIVWYGVNDGLVEYNGYEYKKHQEHNGLKGAPVESLLASRSGKIYAATNKGLFVYEKGRWTCVLNLEGIPAFNIYKIREVSDGSVLLCSRIGLFAIKAGRPVRFFSSPAYREALGRSLQQVEWVMLPDEVLRKRSFSNISDVAEMPGGRWWISITQDGYSLVLQIAPTTIEGGTIRDFQLIPSGSKKPFGETQTILQARDHSIWFSNNSTRIGLHRFDGSRWQYTELSTLFGGDEYTSDIVQSEDGVIWIGALGKLFMHKAGIWSQYKSPEFKIPANRIILAQSQQQQLWIGGHKSKVFRLDYSPQNWITYRNINFECEDKYGNQWFLDVEGRVIHRQGERWISYGEEDGLMDAPARVLVTSKGQVWVAGSHRGVAATAFFSDGKWERQQHPRLSWGIDYRAVFEAKDGSLWFGGSVDFFKEKGQLGGVIQLKNPTQTKFNWVHHPYHQNGLIQSNAYGIGQSPDGRIWIGGGNLSYFDGKAWHRPEQEDLRQFVNIVRSTKDQLLVGSRYYGIFLFDGKKWTQYDMDSGLSSNTVISLFATSPQNIWAATENDIAHFDGHQWVSHVFPEEMNLDMEGGTIFQSADNAIWINKSSREWKRRAYQFNALPQEARKNFVTFRYMPDKQPPETVINFFDPDVSPNGNLIASWSGADFFGDTPGNRLQYSYRLNGGTWSPYFEDTHFPFLDLPSGHYVLEVRARDLDLNVDPTPAQVAFRVRPPVWKQGWFVALLFLFFLTLGFYEYRVHRKKVTLQKLNQSLHTINAALQEKNAQVLEQQVQILAQKQALETSNDDLEARNLEVRQQRDKLGDMVVQVEELSRAKINFFTNISHELRTPLTLILGPVEQLRNPGYSLDRQEQHRLLEIIERNSNRLLKLINQLLEVRLMEDNSMALHTRQGDLALFLEEITELFESLARKKRIQLSFVNYCPVADVYFDSDKIEKIMVNLLSNAFKHTPNGGRISVSLRQVLQEGATMFSIQVEDSGEGIPAKRLARIFERYYSTGEDQASSGIGLSYIRELIELHRGTIQVESKVGAGTTFTILLPSDIADETVEVAVAAKENPTYQVADWEVRYLQQELMVPELPYAEPESRPLYRLLIVDDNEDILDFLYVLFAPSYAVLKARGGEEALRIAANHTVDLIVSDIMMPEMDGLEFCRRLKTDLSTSHIPVVLLTAKDMEENVLEGLETGADDYIVKPFSPPLLKARIENLLRQRERLRLKFGRDFVLTPKEVRLTSPDEALMQRLVDIMEEHIADSAFNVNRMCEMVHLSHMQFIRKVRQLTGQKPIDLLKSYRLKRAKDLLKQNKANISEIAYLVGYDLPNSFSRAFKKEFGFSPSEYVESLGHPSSEALENPK